MPLHNLRCSRLAWSIPPSASMLPCLGCVLAPAVRDAMQQPYCSLLPLCLFVCVGLRYNEHAPTCTILLCRARRGNAHSGATVQAHADGKKVWGDWAPCVCEWSRRGLEPGPPPRRGAQRLAGCAAPPASVCQPTGGAAHWRACLRATSKKGPPAFAAASRPARKEGGSGRRASSRARHTRTAPGRPARAGATSPCVHAFFAAATSAP
jgi:hypothetical protein